MDFLLQTSQSGEVYGGLGFGLNLLCGIASAIIVSRKGHSSYQVVMHAVFGVLCCGIGALISALVAKDLALEERLERMDWQAQGRRQRQYTAPHSSRGLPQPSVNAVTAVAGQVRCPRCGSLNAEELSNCWHCGLVFTQTVSTPSATSPVLAAPPLAQAGVPMFPESETSELDESGDPEVTAKWRKLREDREHERVAHFEQLVGRNLATIRVSCRACGKHFSGQKAKVQATKKCPKCGASPFDYRVLPAGDDRE